MVAGSSLRSVAACAACTMGLGAAAENTCADFTILGSMISYGSIETNAARPFRRRNRSVSAARREIGVSDDPLRQGQGRHLLCTVTLLGNGQDVTTSPHCRPAEHGGKRRRGPV